MLPPIIASLSRLSTGAFSPFLRFSCYKGSGLVQLNQNVANVSPGFYSRNCLRLIGQIHVEIKRISKSDPEYPVSLTRYLPSDAPDAAAAMGNVQILNRRGLAIFCSAVCPAALTRQTQDLIQTLAEGGVTTIGGFHSPVERECLRILLGATQPIILSPARSLDRLRIRPEYREPLANGRLLFLSFFKSHRHRSDIEMAFRRNRFVAALADKIMILHAAPSSNTERLCRELIGWHKSVYTIDNEANQNLVSLGAQALALDSIGELTRGLSRAEDS